MSNPYRITNAGSPSHPWNVTNTDTGATVECVSSRAAAQRLAATLLMPTDRVKEEIRRAFQFEPDNYFTVKILAGFMGRSPSGIRRALGQLVTENVITSGPGLHGGRYYEFVTDDQRERMRRDTEERTRENAFRDALKKRLARLGIIAHDVRFRATRLAIDVAALDQFVSEYEAAKTFIEEHAAQQST